MVSTIIVARAFLRKPIGSHRERSRTLVEEMASGSSSSWMTGAQTGSTTSSPPVHANLPGTFDVLQLSRNVGKAEAVRLGFLHASNRSPLVSASGMRTSAGRHPPLRVDPPGPAGNRHCPRCASHKLLAGDTHRQPIHHYLGRVLSTVVALR
jgi:hypothetical protein